MKKLAIIAVSLIAACGVYAQGTVNFNNRVANPDGGFFVNAPIKTAFGTINADGPTFMVQLYGGVQGAAESSLTAIGAAIPLRTGAGAGYMNVTGLDTSRSIPGVAVGGVAAIQLRAWNTVSGATYEDALAAFGMVGHSDVLFITTGGAGSPPSLPANLVGLQSFSVDPIPEPSTIALGVLGAGSLLFLRRKK